MHLDIMRTNGKVCELLPFFPAFVYTFITWKMAVAVISHIDIETRFLRDEIDSLSQRRDFLYDETEKVTGLNFSTLVGLSQFLLTMKLLSFTLDFCWLSNLCTFFLFFLFLDHKATRRIAIEFRAKQPEKSIVGFRK